MAADYAALARTLTASGILSDPWLDGQPRFGCEPLRLSAAAARARAVAAEQLTAAFDEAVRLCAAEPALVERFFPALTPFQRLMWQAAGSAWHGIARADVFATDTGLQICELNCDTPSGEAEAVLLNAAVAAMRGGRDPNRALGPAFVAACRAWAATLRPRPDSAPLTVGILYPTELVEDLSMILLYQRWLEAAGLRVVLGSPFNLVAAAGGRVALFDVPCDLFVRHYKTDWWGERQPARDDEPPFPDAAPLAAPLGLLLRATASGRAAVINPFAAVLPQNKRMMALLWEAIDRFSPTAQAAIRAHLPYTARLESLAPQSLARADWVLKSDYGCEGAEVVVGAEVDEAAWRDALAHARPERWIAQRRFVAQVEGGGRAVNCGVYVVAGEAAGFFSRVQRGATDGRALTVATLIEDDHE